MGWRAGGQADRQATYRRMEHIDGINSCFASLLVSKDKVNPERQVFTSMYRLKRLTVNQNKASGITMAPWRQLNIIYLLSTLTNSKVEL
jgi:hypothetical protein